MVLLYHVLDARPLTNRRNGGPLLVLLRSRLLLRMLLRTLLQPLQLGVLCHGLDSIVLVVVALGHRVLLLRLVIVARIEPKRIRLMS